MSNRRLATRGSCYPAVLLARAVVGVVAPGFPAIREDAQRNMARPETYNLHRLATPPASWEKREGGVHKAKKLGIQNWTKHSSLLDIESSICSAASS